MGEDLVTIGMVVGLDYRDAELSVHDLLQELKTHPKIRRILEGGERVEWGAKTIPEGGFLSLPKRLNAPGLLLCGDGAGFVNVPALKGIHYAIESGRLAAEAACARAPARRVGRPARRARRLRRVDPRELRLERPVAGAQHAAGVRHGLLVGSGIAGAARSPRSARFPPRDLTLERDAEQDLITTGRASTTRRRTASCTFDKLSSVFASGNKTRDDQPNHIRIEHARPARRRRDVGAHVPGPGVRGRPRGRRPRRVIVTPSNCVQCGAITAKGGRLTPPEGGSGPEYHKT